jgi:phosphopantothenoylcysteine synthetase/decarboxylase
MSLRNHGSHWRGTPFQTAAIIAAMPVLYLVVCGAPPAAEIPSAARGLQAGGWDVCVIATPAALHFIDRDGVEHATGHPVRSEPRRPGERDSFPPADAVAVAPLTFNSANKWALGISDTLALGVLHELMGAGLPIVAGVWAKEPLRRHPAFDEHIARLRRSGVRFLEPGSGPDGYDWSALQALLPDPTG